MLTFLSSSSTEDESISALGGHPDEPVGIGEDSQFNSNQSPVGMLLLYIHQHYGPRSSLLHEQFTGWISVYILRNDWRIREKTLEFKVNFPIY